MATFEELKKRYEDQLKRRQMIVKMYFVDGETNFAEIARKVGLTRQRVQAIIESEKVGKSKK